MRNTHAMKFKTSLGAAALLVVVGLVHAQEDAAQNNSFTNLLIEDASQGEAVSSEFLVTPSASLETEYAPTPLPLSETSEQPPLLPVSNGGDSFFNVPHAPDPLLAISRQGQVLEQYNGVAAMMRDIKKEGNDDAVLALLSALAGDEATLEVLKAVFDTIDVTPPVVYVPAADLSPRIVPAPSGQSPAAPAVVADKPAVPAEVTPPKPPVPVAPALPRHPIVPVFAQTYSEQGGREKVIVSVGGQRFIGLPGETIRVDGRRITVEEIVSKIDGSGRETFTIYISENGVREALSWN